MRLYESLFFILLALVAVSLAGPMKMYKKKEDKIYQRVLVAVSSTVIPLDSLPEFQIGVGLGSVTPSPGKIKIPKPHKDDIKLITAKKKYSYKKKVKKGHNYEAAVEEI